MLQVFLPDRLGELCVLLVHLLQVLVSLLGVLLSVPHLILQRGPGSFQLLLQTGHLRTDTTLTSIVICLKKENKQDIHITYSTKPETWPTTQNKEKTSSWQSVPTGNMISCLVTQIRSSCTERPHVTAPVRLCPLNGDYCALFVVKDRKYDQLLKCAQLRRKSQAQTALPEAIRQIYHKFVICAGCISAFAYRHVRVQPHWRKEEVKRVDSYKYLWVQINKKVDWAHSTEALLRKGQSRLFFLRRLRSFSVCNRLLQIFYQSVVASALFFAVGCWGGGIKAWKSAVSTSC